MNTVVPLWGRPTLYRGIKMRSRLEARVAASLDEYGDRWQYEPLCFADGPEQYLPDFELLGHEEVLGSRSFLEVKPPLTDVGRIKAKARMLIIRASLPDAAFFIYEAVDSGCVRIHIGTVKQWHDDVAFRELP